MIYIFAIVVLIVGAILLQGLRRIPANPPHKGQKTWKGKRVEREKVEKNWRGKVKNNWYDEGWGFYPFFPYFSGFILVKVERVTQEVTLENTRTPDRAVSRVPISLTWRPVEELLINFIDSGQEKGVREQLNGMVQEKIREWAMSDEYGPATWVELNKSQLEAVSVLISAIAGKTPADIAPIPLKAQLVPTWIWLRYFSQPRPTILLQNEKPWAEPVDESGEWKKIRKVLDTLNEDEQKELEKSVDNRRDKIKNLRRGNGQIIINDLGIRLERLNIGDIEVLGKVAENADQEAKEEQQRKAEGLELQFVRERITELMAPPFNYTRAEARDIVQTERGKVVKAIDDKHITLDATTAEIVARVLGGRKP